MLRSLCIALFASLCIAPSARAQDIGVQILTFQGRTDGQFDLSDLARTDLNPITLGECESGAQIQFRFTMIDTLRSNLDFFVGSQCDDPTIRTDGSTDLCNDLPIPNESTGNRPQVDMTISAADLVGGCGTADSGVDTIWVLAVDNPGDTVTTAGQKVQLAIAHDFSGPDELTGFEATGGESSAMLSWDTPTGQNSNIEIYLDPSGCGEIADPPPAGLRVASIEGTTDGHTLPFPDTVPIPGQVGIAIRSIDEAGNAGALSETLCVNRFEVMSWWEAYCGDMPDTEVCNSTGGGCAASRSRASWIAIAFAALAIVFAVRRSR